MQLGTISTDFNSRNNNKRELILKKKGSTDFSNHMNEVNGVS